MDIIMSLGTIFFMVLFIMLLFNFVIFAISLFHKKQEIVNFNPKLTVAIPCYNEEKNIGACLNSLLKNKYSLSKVEFIVIDDGSSDNTLNVIKSFKTKMKKALAFKIIRQNHEGKVEALNKAVKKSSTDYFISLDADTIAEKYFLANMIQPFHDPSVGASSGAVRVRNIVNFLTLFQNLEYHSNNLIRNYFSKVFKHGIWFFGCLSCYRKDALQKVGYFKKDTVAEDMDIAMEISDAGYLTINVENAIGYTNVPVKFKDLLNQRSRWWNGGLQSLNKNKHMLTNKSSFAIKYIFWNQLWWSFFALVSLPIIIYQVAFWFPTGSSAEVFLYLFRWFSLWGPVYVLYKIPEWGINLYNIFGVLSGVISCLMLIFAIKLYKDKVNLRNMFGLFFYFPYTILLNLIIMFSIFKKENRYFIEKESA